MTFRHWTAAVRVPEIVEGGIIWPTDSMLHPVHHVPPSVVWLLPSGTDPGAGHDNGLYDAKRTGWIDVNVPAIRWLDWSPTLRMNPAWKAAMIEAGGGIECAAHWYVWPAAIRAPRFVDHGTIEVPA